MVAVTLPSVCSMSEKLLLTFTLQCCSAAAGKTELYNLPCHFYTTSAPSMGSI